MTNVDRIMDNTHCFLKSPPPNPNVCHGSIPCRSVGLFSTGKADKLSIINHGATLRQDNTGRCVSVKGAIDKSTKSERELANKPHCSRHAGRPNARGTHLLHNTSLLSFPLAYTNYEASQC